MWRRDTVEVSTARPASVGSVLGATPELSFGLTWPQAEFDRVWVLALSGHLKFAHLYFTKSHYNSGLVVSASFSGELEEYAGMRSGLKVTRAIWRNRWLNPHPVHPRRLRPRGHSQLLRSHPRHQGCGRRSGAAARARRRG